MAAKFIKTHNYCPPTTNEDFLHIAIAALRIFSDENLAFCESTKRLISLRSLDPNLRRVIRIIFTEEGSAKLQVDVSGLKGYIVDLQTRLEQPDGCEPAVLGNVAPGPAQVYAKRLKIMLPSRTKAPSAMVSPQDPGKITEHPPEIANFVHSYWQGIWDKKTIDSGILRGLLRDHVSPLDPGIFDWEPYREAVLKIIQKSGNTSPGPDGISFACWRSVPQTTTTLLLEIFQHISQGGDVDTCFNKSLLYLIPKKPLRTCDIWGELYSPKQFRPISVGHTINRLYSKVVHSVLAPIMGEYLDPAQKGFLKGRDIAEAVEFLNESFYDNIENDEDKAVVLIDFVEAFPSISHEAIFITLEYIGVPKGFINTIAALYTNIQHDLVWKGKIYPSATMHSGIRQGDPLSPTLLAVVMNFIFPMLKEHGFRSGLLRMTSGSRPIHETS
jgi:hypothetical protein